MKLLNRTLALVGLVALMCISMGIVGEMRYSNSRIGSMVNATFQSDYEQVAALSSANGDPAVGARDYATLDALADTAMAIWEVPKGVNAVSVRFRINADADTATVRAMTFRQRANPGDYMDDASLAYQWALTGGQQVAKLGGVYCDTGTATAYAIAGGTANTVQANWIYEYEFDLSGVSYVAFYRTDATAAITVRVDVAVY